MPKPPAKPRKVVRLKEDPSNIKIGSHLRLLPKSSSQILRSSKVSSGQAGVFDWLDAVSYDDVCDGEEVGSGETGEVIKMEWKNQTGDYFLLFRISMDSYRFLF